MTSDQYYFQPKCDPRIYEEALHRATYLIDNGYIKLTTGQSMEDVVGQMIITLEKKERDEKLSAETKTSD